jgi:hypothetical protein
MKKRVTCCLLLAVSGMLVSPSLSGCSSKSGAEAQKIEPSDFRGDASKMSPAARKQMEQMQRGPARK